MDTAYSTAPPTPSSPAKAGLIALGLLALALLGVVIHDRWPAARPRPAAKAVIVRADGSPADAVGPARSFVVLTSHGSVAASVRWRGPAGSVELPDYLVVPTGEPGTVVEATLFAVEGGTLDEATVRIPVGAPGPAPPPGPSPTPGPVPGPVPPAPSGPVDPAIRRAAAAYFGGYVARYRAIDPRATDYNAAIAAIAAWRKDAGTALGQAVDAVLQPQLDAQARWKDPAAAAAAAAAVADSLAAGLGDALAPPR